jgi:hypothetical protein
MRENVRFQKLKKKEVNLRTFGYCAHITLRDDVTCILPNSPSMW